MTEEEIPIADPLPDGEEAEPDEEDLEIDDTEYEDFYLK